MYLRFFNYLIIFAILTYPIFGLDKHIKWIKSGHAVPINHTTYLNNNSLAVSTDVAGYLKLWNLDSNRIDAFYMVSNGSPTVYPTNDPSELIIQYGNQFSLISIDGKIIKSKFLNTGILSYDLTEKRDLIAISYFYKSRSYGKDPVGEYGCGVEIWDLNNDSLWFIKQTYKSGKLGDLILPTIFDRFVSFSSDEKIIAISHDSGYVNFYQISDGNFLSSIKLNSDTITSMYFKNDILIISDNHGNIKAWEYPAGNLLYNFNKFQNIYSTIKSTKFLSKDNKYLITYKNPNHDSLDVIFLWDLNKNSIDDSVKINIKGLNYYTFSYDRKKILCILKNNELVEKNILDTNQIQKLSLNYGAINSIDFNDSLLIAAYSNKDIKIHSINDAF
ncbi:MAG: hypothetical protein M1419_00395, partial [Bacteroidetes bacterium]|nr:hypothetical protein [Bacteroidota bacterium]